MAGTMSDESHLPHTLDELLDVQDLQGLVGTIALHEVGVDCYTHW